MNEARGFGWITGVINLSETANGAQMKTKVGLLRRGRGSLRPIGFKVLKPLVTILLIRLSGACEHERLIRKGFRFCIGRIAIIPQRRELHSRGFDRLYLADEIRVCVSVEFAHIKHLAALLRELHIDRKQLFYLDDSVEPLLGHPVLVLVESDMHADHVDRAW